MYYNLLGVTQDADEKTIKDAYFARFKDGDAKARMQINKAKSCLTDEASRTAYNQALVRFGI